MSETFHVAHAGLGGQNLLVCTDVVAARPLMTVDGREPAEVNLDDWQRVIQLADDDAATGALTRELLAQHLTKGHNLAHLRALRGGKCHWRT
ncbi:hypothetical protein [Paraburkholderia sp.]|uniref:hypothetical protein n=1 Tax=Paraburkholderia sp. TaxID=1926495 RepID=UPI0039E57E3E